MENFTTCGLDEAGRGALAGPLVAAGVTIDANTEKAVSASGLPIRDSKKMTGRQRQMAVELIRRLEIPFALVKITPHFINSHGIQKANIAAFTRIISKIEAVSYIADGNLPIRSRHNKKVKSQPHADSVVLPVILAGIIAKVYRDELMQKLARHYPRYGWEQNAGYGTQKHIKAIRQHGSTCHHRTQFVTTALSHVRASDI